MHPHPDCLYENEDGEMVAEDEEGCMEEYKRKGLVTRSANFKCQSPIHNCNSPAISRIGLKYGIKIDILGTRCNGLDECWNSIDEDNCGFDTSITATIGK